MQELGFNPGSAGFFSWYYFLLATQVCHHLDHGLKREHRVGRKPESHSLRKTGRKTGGCTADRGGGQRRCNPYVGSSGQRQLGSSVIPGSKTGTKEEAPGRQNV